MPNTIKITSSVSWSDGAGNILKTSFTNTDTQTGTAVIEAIQNVGTSIETIQLGDVVPGTVCFVNRDATNNVTIYSDSGALNIVAVLTPGEGVILPTTVTAFWGKATGAAVNLLVLAFSA